MNRILIVALVAVVACSAAPKEFRRPRFDGRIVGGETIDIRDAPYQISLQNNGFHMCGGSILNARFIFTAAHCTYGQTANKLQVRMGTSEYSNGGIVMQVVAIHQHKQYSPSNIDYDYSILELGENIPFDETMQPIALPAQDEDVKDGTILEVSGWGNTQSATESNRVLREARVPKVNDEDCDEAYSGYGGITDRMICAGYKEGGKDACQGDSGGPLVAGDQLVGIVSWGFGCAKPDYPGVYSRVAVVTDWATDIIRCNNITVS